VKDARGRDVPGASASTHIHRKGGRDVPETEAGDGLVRAGALVPRREPGVGALGYASARDMLDDVVQLLRTYAGAQHSGHDLSRAEVRRQADQIARLFDRHIRPIVTIARSQIAPESDAGLPSALRLPKANLGSTKVLAACDGMIEAARQFEAVFVANGLPANFLAQFQGARDTLAREGGCEAMWVVGPAFPAG